MKFLVGNSRCCRLRFDYAIVVLLCCVSATVGRGLPLDFDLEAEAAEPRPIVIESGPSAEALPLVYLDEPIAEPLTETSEKVEKVLSPALSFKYNDNSEKQIEDLDREPAESKHEERPSESAVEFHEFVSAVPRKDEANNDSKPAQTVVEQGEEVAESKNHKHKEKHDGGNSEFEKGGGKEFKSDHHAEHGDEGEKDYKGHHHHEKGKKGHHDKEAHKKEYDEGGGHKKHHHHEDGYQGEHFKSHGGKKGAKFKEEGDHSKGHSTKGSHSIHKKDEFEKKTEFFEEDHEGGESEKHGGYSHSEEFHKGGHKKGGHKNGGDHEEEYGKKGASAKGGHYKDEHGHDEKEGHSHHHAHDTKHGDKEAKSIGKKWAFKKSHDNGGGGGGKGGHGHGAHSHQTYAVQEPPPPPPPKKKNDHGHTAHSHQSYAVRDPPDVSKYPFQTYEISPIPPFVLPLEGESQANANHLKPTYHSTKFETTKRKTKKRRPTPEDDFMADNPYSTSNIKVTKQETVTPSIEDLIQQELEFVKKSPIGPPPEPKQLNTVESAPMKITKRRRLKKRKLLKDSKTQASAHKGAKCPLSHKERVVPEGSSHSFVIVAADDAV